MDVIAVSPYVSHLLTEFHWLLDNGHGEHIADLFAAEAVVETVGLKLSGQAQIREFYSDRRRFPAGLTRHYWSNLRCSVQGEIVVSEANIMTIFQPVNRGENRVMLRAGVLKDRILFAGRESKFVARFLELQFEAPLADCNQIVRT